MPFFVSKSSVKKACHRSTACMRRKRAASRVELIRHVIQNNALERTVEPSPRNAPLLQSSNELVMQEMRIEVDIAMHGENSTTAEPNADKTVAAPEYTTSNVESDANSLNPLSYDTEIPSSPQDTSRCEAVAADTVEDDSAAQDIKILTETLCNCCDTTVGDLVYMNLCLGQRHGWTWSSQVDNLKMIASIHKKTVNSIPQSSKTLLSKLDNKDIDVMFYVFCPDCELMLGERAEDKSWAAFCHECQEKSHAANCDSDLTCTKCNNLLGCRQGKKWYISCYQCHNEVPVLGQKNVFVGLSLEQQLKEFVNRKGIAEMLLKYRFERKKNNPSALEDIYDGEEYMRHFRDGGILSNPYNFSFTFFTDGISTGKSNGKTLWPIYVKINELPFQERMRHTFLCGLYIGSKEPSQLLVLEPFVAQCNKLSTEGFSWVHNNETVNSKVIPVCAVVDSVARCQVLNMQNFHAYYGCTFCYQKQEKTQPRKRIFNMMDEASPLRTPESTHEDAVVAYSLRHKSKPEDRVHQGVKGPSALVNLLYFNLILGFSVDYMHAILLGIVKTHMKYLFESSRKKFWIGVTERTALTAIQASIDEKLLTIRPPACITRTPRSISQWKLWKASEWRSWILFYCIPCLDGFLKDKYVVHLAMLSKALWICLQKSITLEDLDLAHSLLIDYGRKFQDYFQLQDTVYNLHLLTHIRQSVLSFGPLWAHNAFCYEGENRNLLKLYTSPNNVLISIARRFKIYSTLPILVNKLVSNFEAIDFCEEVLGRHVVNYVRCGNALLSCVNRNPIYSSKERDALRAFCLADGALTNYNFLLSSGKLFTCAIYAESKMNNNSIVVSNKNRFYEIRHIVMNNSNEIALVCIKLMLYKEYQICHPVNISHLYRVKEKMGKMVCLGLKDVKCQGVQIKAGDDMYVAEMPIGCYGD